MNSNNRKNLSGQLLGGIDRYIEHARNACKNVGVAVAVVQGDKVVYARGFGLRKHDVDAPVDENTLFQVGSTTKAFTCAALAILVEEKKLRWDDPVVEHLPYFELADPWLTRTLSIRDSVSHRSGIADSSYPFFGIMNTEQAIRQLRYSPSRARFRDSYLYSNLMYAVAGEIIARASGVSWNEFVKANLLRPLNMHRSGTSAYEFWDSKFIPPSFIGRYEDYSPALEDARDANVAMPHGCGENGSIVTFPWQSYDNASAAGTIVSSAADMAQWVMLHLNGGHYGERQLLKPETVRELHAPQNLFDREATFPLDEVGGYAMGWSRSTYGGHTHLQHSGGIIGFPAYVAMLPDRRIGVVVLSNGSAATRARLGVHKLSLHKSIAFWVFDRLLDAPEHNWSDEILERAAEFERSTQAQEDELRRARLANVRPTFASERYSGIYEDLLTESRRLIVRAGCTGLTLCFPGERAYTVDMEHWHQDIFRLRLNPMLADVLGAQFASFTVDPRGNVAAMSTFDSTFRRISDDTH